VVRTNGTGTLITQCERLDTDNTRRSCGRAQGPLDVFVFSQRGMIVTGLPEQRA
jgi:hypothetical protein